MDTNQALNRIEAILAGHRQPIRGRVMSGHFIYFRGCIPPEYQPEIELALGCKVEITSSPEGNNSIVELIY